MNQQQPSVNPTQQSGSNNTQTTGQLPSGSTPPTSRRFDNCAYFLTALAAVIATLAAIQNALDGIYSVTIGVKQFNFNLSKVQARLPYVTSTYIERYELEKRVLEAYSNDLELMSGSYFLVVGPKGAGKTTLVNKAFHGKIGVIKVIVDQSSTSLTIVEKIAKIVTKKEIIDEELFTSALDEARKRKDNPVTIVLEVDRKGNVETLSAVKYFAKRYSMYANIVIILSEANACLDFGDDPMRQEFIWVDEMSHDEARKYAKRLGISVDVDPTENSSLLDHFFAKVGTLPLAITLLSKKLKVRGYTKENLMAVMNEILEIAKNDLIKFEHKPILEALQDSPNGVPLSFFDGVRYEGVLLSNPTLVGPAMKQSNAIMYHFPSREYRLTTTAHRTALQMYKSKKE